MSDMTTSAVSVSACLVYLVSNLSYRCLYLYSCLEIRLKQFPIYFMLSLELTWSNSAHIQLTKISMGAHEFGVEAIL